MSNPIAVDVAQYAELRLPELLVLEEVSSALVESKRHLRRRTASTRRRSRAAAASSDKNKAAAKLKNDNTTFERKDVVVRRRTSSSTGLVENDSVVEENEKEQKDVEITPPCRASRRRPAVLLHERSVHSLGCKPRMLETHIWHSKRMVMREKWGVMLPVKSQRGKLATVKAATRYALLQDVSYVRTIELIGSQADIHSVLCKGLFDDSRTPSWTKDQLNGVSVATLLCKFCPFSAMWSPSTNCVQKLWLWCHLAATSELFYSLKAAAETLTAEHSDRIANAAGVSTQPVSIAFVPLVRLRIRGKHSHTIAQRVFVEFSGKDSSNSKISWSTVTWKEGSIIGLNLLDPREILPSQSRDTKLSREALLAGLSLAEMKTKTFSEDLRTVPMSDLWEDAKRRVSTCDIHSFPDHVLNSLRSRRRAKDAWYNNYQDGKSQTGTPNLSEPQHYPLSIPSVLVCLGDRNTIGGGWDVILPEGWARPFWGALVFAGGRASALNDIERLHLELDEPSFPQDFPNTPAGRNYWNAKRQYRVDDEVKEGTATTLGSRNDTLFIQEGQTFLFAKIELDCGVVNSGAQVYIAEEEHRIARATALATTGGGGKAWKGVTGVSGNNWEPHCIGWVTSGGFSIVWGRGIALAVCDCDQDMLLKYSERHTTTNIACSAEQDVKSHSSYEVYDRKIAQDCISIDTKNNMPLEGSEAIGGRARGSSYEVVVLVRHNKVSTRFYPGILKLLK